jgi:lysozyme family protein
VTGAAPVKTKTKTTTPAAAVKTKTKAPAAPAAPKPVPVPDDAKVEAKATALTANMRQALNLTPAQAEKVQQLNVTSVRNVETARLQYRTDLRKLNSVIDDIGQSRLAGLKDLLTPDQFARYQRKREEKMGIQAGAANQGNAVPGLPGGGNE